MRARASVRGDDEVRLTLRIAHHLNRRQLIELLAATDLLGGEGYEPLPAWRVDAEVRRQLRLRGTDAEFVPADTELHRRAAEAVDRTWPDLAEVEAEEENR